jgi:hypothetical protein
MNFNDTRREVEDQGRPPLAWLAELVEWAKEATDDIFAVNPNPYDIYAHMAPILGPFKNFLHRKAALLEEMRVHAGFESSWDWNEGVDITNKASMAHKEGQETGVFQVSYDSTYLGHGAMKPFALDHGIGHVDSFIDKMKSDHKLALEYYARLVRVSVRWAGPIIRHEIDPWLSRAAVTEFELLLTS